MRKIVRGSIYDTDKATKIGEDGYDGYAGDCYHWYAALYKTPRSGQYFVAGHGGAMSRFGQSAGANTWEGGEDIIPMSEKDAFEWAEGRLTPEQIQAHFPDMIEET